MQKDIQQVINAIATDVQAIARALMDKGAGDGSRASVKELRGRYRKEDIVVEVSAAGGGNGAVISVLYDSLLEWDRKPRTGQQPSVSDIRDWALSKGLPADNGTLDLIRRSIWWSGHDGCTIEEMLEKEIEKHLDGDWGDMILDAIGKELEKVFA